MTTGDGTAMREIVPQRKKEGFVFTLQQHSPASMPYQILLHHATCGLLHPSTRVLTADEAAPWGLPVVVCSKCRGRTPRRYVA